MTSLLVVFFSCCILLCACTNLLLFPLSIWKKSIIFFFLFINTYLLTPILGQATTPFTLLGIFILICIFDKHYLINICCSLLGYLLSITLNYIFTIFCVVLLHITMEQIQGIYIIPFSLTFLILLICITVPIQKQLKKALYFLTKENVSSKINYLLCFFLLICAAIYVVNIIYGSYLNYSFSIILLNGILFFMFFIATMIILFFMFRTLKKEETMKLKMTNYETMQNYTQKLEDEYLNIRSFKHDYINILSSLYAYIEEENLTALKEYFFKELFPLEADLTSSDAKLALLSNIESYEVKGLFYSKLLFAIYNNINITIDIKERISISGNINIVDLTRVLGIFLDNAIEAALETENKELTIALIKKGQQTTIIIHNSCLNHVIDLAQIYSLNYSSKGEHRGLGLFQAKKILDQYNTLLLTTNLKNNYFSQKLELF